MGAGLLGGGHWNTWRFSNPSVSYSTHLSVLGWGGAGWDKIKFPSLNPGQLQLDLAAPDPRICQCYTAWLTLSLGLQTRTSPGGAADECGAVETQAFRSLGFA